MSNFWKGAFLGLFVGSLPKGKTKDINEGLATAGDVRKSLANLDEKLKDVPGTDRSEKLNHVIKELSGITVNQLPPPLDESAQELYNEIRREQGKDKAEEFKKIYQEERRKSNELRIKHGLRPFN